MTQIHNYFANGQDSSAISLANSNLVGLSDDAGTNGYGYYLSWGNMYIDFKNVSSNSDVSNYSRDLDLNTAIAGVNYDKGSTHYSRENFTSYPDNVIVTHITADGSEKISLDVSVEPDNTSGGAANSIGENGYKRTWNTTVSGGRISVNGQLTDNQMKFSSQTQVITGLDYGKRKCDNYCRLGSARLGSARLGRSIVPFFQRVKSYFIQFITNQLPETGRIMPWLRLFAFAGRMVV